MSTPTPSVGLPKVLTEAVRKVELVGVSFELTLDLRRLRPRHTRLNRFAVLLDPEEVWLLLSLDELDVLEELEELSISCNTPG